MANSPYVPLLNATDMLVRRPLHEWRKALLVKLKDSLASRQLDVGTIAVVMNQVPLLDAFCGRNDDARIGCEAQIYLWKAVSEYPGRRSVLSSSIQPWVNLIRLERWQQQYGASVAFYRELAPELWRSHGELQKRFRIVETLGELIDLEREQDARIESVVKNVYWLEYTRLLMMVDDDDTLFAHILSGLESCTGPLRVQLFELLVICYVQRQEYDKAAVMLKKIKLTKPDFYWLAFKVLELYVSSQLHVRDNSNLVKIVHESALTIGESAAPSAYGTNFLLNISRVFRSLQLVGPEIDVLNLVNCRAMKLNDEMLLFEAQSRLASLGDMSQEQLHDGFHNSSYQLIRTRLGLTGGANDGGEFSSLVQKVANRIAQFDFNEGLRLLNEYESTSEAMIAVV